VKGTLGQTLAELFVRARGDGCCVSARVRVRVEIRAI